LKNCFRSRSPGKPGCWRTSRRVRRSGFGMRPRRQPPTGMSHVPSYTAVSPAPMRSTPGQNPRPDWFPGSRWRRKKPRNGAKPGEYVVHEHYGIGRYKGLELVNALGQEAEYLKLEYRAGDRLFVPLAEFRQVQKYSGSEGKNPRLNSLDTATWERVKARVMEG